MYVEKQVSNFVIIIASFPLMFRFYRARSKQYDPKRVAHHALSKSSLSAKDKRSPLMNSENDLLQPNTGDIPMETLNHIRM